MPVEVVLGDVQHARPRPGRTDGDQCSWKLDSSTASTSWRRLARPPSTHRRCRCCRSAARVGPAARRIDSSMPTVVVLPLVPVTASHGAARPVRRLRRVRQRQLGLRRIDLGTRPRPPRPAAAWSRPPARRGDDEAGAGRRRRPGHRRPAALGQVGERLRRAASVTVTRAPSRSSGRRGGPAGDRRRPRPARAAPPQRSIGGSADGTAAARQRSATRCRTARARARRTCAASSQNRMITVVSAHPPARSGGGTAPSGTPAAAWCGTRRSASRPTASRPRTRPPMTTSSSSVRVTIDRPAISPPSASEPVSPMKIRAGCGVPPEEPDAGRPSRRRRRTRDVERVAHLVAAAPRERQSRRCCGTARSR